MNKRTRLSMKLLRRLNTEYRAETTYEKTRTIDVFLDFVEEALKEPLENK